MTNNRKKYFYPWLLRGGSGAILFGTGICATIEVAFMRYDGAPFLNWFILGTISLALMVAGISLIADSVRFKIKMNE